VGATGAGNGRQLAGEVSGILRWKAARKSLRSLARPKSERWPDGRGNAGGKAPEIGRQMRGVAWPRLPNGPGLLMMLGDTMTKPTFAEIWLRLVAQADRPFLTDGGHEFSYRVEGEALLLSHRDALLPRALLAKAWATMPCAAAALPAECKPKGYVWTLLHDTRVAGTGLLPEIPPALAEAAKRVEKSAAELRPKPRKRRSNRAVARARKRAETKRRSTGG